MKSNITLGLIALAAWAAGCKKSEFGDAKILVSGTEVSPIVKFTVENTPSEFAVTASATEKVTEDVNVVFEFDPAAVDRYNEENNTTYFAAPQRFSLISAGVSARSQTLTSATRPLTY